jgi:hypothetical protein
MVHLASKDRTNTTAQFLYEGAQELLGADFLQTVMQKRSPASGCDWTLAEIRPFLRSLEARFGEPSSHGLTLRIGRAAFRYGLKQLGEQAGFYAANFRLLPAPRRLESGLRTLAAVVADGLGDQVAVAADEGAWYWKMRWEGEMDGRYCYLVTGMLQEFSSWAGNGRFYQVKETECQAAGAQTCTFRIDKKPLD